MKTLLKIIAVAAAFGMAPAGALAQSVAPAQPNQEATSAKPADIATKAGETALSAAPAPAPAPASTPAQAIARAAPTPGIGQPDGRMGVQDQVTSIGERAAWFHNQILLPVITAISIFVLCLLLYIIVRYRRGANPVPSRTAHNTWLEVIWTLIPVLILVLIAVPSIKLLSSQYSPPKADLTVKVIGNQWYWTYQYPDNGDFEIVSNILSDEEDKQRGEPRLLGVDERMVVPAGATVKVIVTSNDVIHAFAMPAFWNKLDAVPGRLNETWFKVDRPGVYYGQCSELCGAPPAQFAAWVASKGGKMPGAQAPVKTANASAAGTADQQAAASQLKVAQ
jgi:cytochrome c oxidase subunit 2